LSIPRGSDSSGMIWIIYVLPALAIISAILSYFLFRSRAPSQVQSESKFYEPKLEKIILFILGLICIFFMFLAGYYSYDSGIIFLIPVVFPVLILTRQWPFYKRIIWVLAMVFLVVLILSLKPQNF
jgi:cytochrome c oxidase assembly factor CtaG